MTKSRFWADLSTREFAQLDPARTVAVLPLGATEQHGPHLPLSVDQVLVDGIIAARLPQPARRRCRCCSCRPSRWATARSTRASTAR